MASRFGIFREDVRKTNKEYYSLRDNKVNFYLIPGMNFIESIGSGKRDIYKMHDYKEVWTIGRFINRVKYYTVRELGKNFSRMPLELAWGDSDNEYKASMWVPEYISDDLFEVTMSDLGRKYDFVKDLSISLIFRKERNCAQLLHFGEYNQIESSKQYLLEGIYAEGFTPTGKLGEIFLNHPHCNPPDKLQILLRQEIADSKLKKAPDIT